MMRKCAPHFRRGEDIHRRTASLVYGVSPESVTMRCAARRKRLISALSTAWGAYGLSQSAGMTRDEAGKFIEEYLEHFFRRPHVYGVDEEICIGEGICRDGTGATTVLAELRTTIIRSPLPAERMAINMPVQGPEADIVKLSMIAVDRFVREQFAGRRVCFQIHDELILKSKNPSRQSSLNEVKGVMESVYALTYRSWSMSVGKNWERRERYRGSM